MATGNVKKIVFKQLSTRGTSYTAIGGIRFYDNGGFMFNTGNILTNNPTTGTFDFASVTATGSYASSYYYPVCAFNSKVTQTGSYTQNCYWLTSGINQEISITFNTPQQIAKIEFNPNPDTQTDRNVRDFVIDAFDSSGTLIRSYNITPITTNNTVQILNTPELESDYFDVKNASLTKSAVWYTDTIAQLDFSCILDSTRASQIQYKILLNGTQIYPSVTGYTDLYNVPVTVNLPNLIDVSTLTIGTHIITISLKSNDGYVKDLDIPIYKEDESTQPIVRNPVFLNEWDDSFNKFKSNLNNLTVSLKPGVYQGYLTTASLSQIRTTGKRGIDNVMVHADNDGIENIDIKETMNLSNSTTNGKLLSYAFDKSKFSGLYSLSIEVIEP